MRTHSRDGGFAIPEQLRVAALSFDGGLVTVDAFTEKLAPDCPCCGWPSRRVHGNYTRTLADLPWAGVPVRPRARARPSAYSSVNIMGGSLQPGRME